MSWLHSSDFQVFSSLSITSGSCPSALAYLSAASDRQPLDRVLTSTASCHPASCPTFPELLQFRAEHLASMLLYFDGCAVSNFHSLSFSFMLWLRIADSNPSSHSTVNPSRIAANRARRLPVASACGSAWLPPRRYSGGWRKEFLTSTHVFHTSINLQILDPEPSSCSQATIIVSCHSKTENMTSGPGRGRTPRRLCQHTLLGIRPGPI